VSSERLANDALLRADSLINFWAEQGIDIVKITSKPSIVKAQITKRMDSVDLIVYEWTWVDYNNGEGANSKATDRMGFATIHDITAIMGKDGSYTITRDSYDEADISGYTSPDYDPIEFESATKGIATDDLYRSAVSEMECKPLAESYSALSTLNGNGMPNVFACIDYANTWVIKDYANDLNNHYEHYNTNVYGYISGSDCCNFVSQCLYAGGLLMDKDNASNPSDSYGWWHKRDGIATNSSKSWRSISYFLDYWGDKYDEVDIIANLSNVYPGNPVFSYDKEHVVICVGYNTAGYPIINGHNRDVYHQALTSNSYYSSTLLINTSIPMINRPGTANNVPYIPYTYPSNQLYLNAGKAEWFKFTPSQTGYYSVYSTGSTDTVGYLYRESQVGSGGTMYLFELYYNDDGMLPGDGVNMRVGAYLYAGETYYVMVRGYSPLISGYYNLVFQQG
jgi:hypothetical protein